jgi:hypothetical protein
MKVFAERLTQQVQIGCARFRVRAIEIADHRHRPLLRARRDHLPYGAVFFSLNQRVI